MACKALNLTEHMFVCGCGPTSPHLCRVGGRRALAIGLWHRGRTPEFYRYWGWMEAEIKNEDRGGGAKVLCRVEST